jgi:hypothetical protein
MTFYSILYSVLFISSFSNMLLIVISKREFLYAVISAIFCLVIINDIIYSSHQLDKDSEKYLLAMKFIDLLNFLVLSIGLILISPQNNIFVGNLSTAPSFLISEYRIMFIWLTIGIYFSISIIWDFLFYKSLMKNIKTKFFRWFRENGLFQIISIALCFFQIIAAYLFVHYQKKFLEQIECYISVLWVITLFIYITIYKPIKLRGSV